MIAFESTGTGPPLALIHGVGTNRSVWGDTGKLLGTNHRVIAADLPGFGESPALGDGFDLEEVAGAVADSLAQEAGGPFDLVGNSLGGAVAFLLALRHPERVRRLVLCAPAGFSPLPGAIAETAGLLGNGLISARRLLADRLADSAAGRLLLVGGAISDPAALSPDQVRAMASASRGATRIGPAIAAVAGADLRPRLAELRVPTGLIWGESDRVVPIKALASIRELLPDAVVETLPGAGHVAHFEEPEVFAAALERLLNRIG